MVEAPPSDAPATKSAKTKAPGGRQELPIILRLLAWVIAIPLGLILVGVPARRAGYLTGQKLLDVVIGRDLNRYFPLVVIVVLWALVTSVLVQLLAEGGGWLMRRRRARRADIVDA